MTDTDLFEELLPEMMLHFLDGKLLDYLSSQGLKKDQSIEWFIRVGTHVAAEECEANPDGALRLASWKRVYTSKQSLLKTLLCLPLLAVGWMRSYHDEQSFVSAHRLSSGHLRGYYLRRFAATLLQVLCGVTLTGGVLSLVFLIAYYCSGEVPFREYLYMIPAIVVIGLCANGFKRAKRFGLPAPLRVYSCDGLFEFQGLEKR